MKYTNASAAIAVTKLKPGIDVVLDVGAGFGFLTHFLSDKCRAVIAVEKDSKVAAVLREKVKDITNVTVIEGDILKAIVPPFDKVIAIPPYYLSSKLMLWVLDRKVNCGILILQKEFCERLLAPVGAEQYGWLTVFSQYKAEVKILDTISKDMFYPAPEVDSTIISLRPWSNKPFEIKNEKAFVKLVKWLFTERNKKITKAINPYLRINFKLSRQEAEKLATTLPFHDKRVRELSPQNFGEMSNALPD
jgi:16S rRNA (adenine1518-N6/adenine1519-N6)-dimethyltransferase